MLNLLATIIICVGLANVSPFNHASNESNKLTPTIKKANTTTNYNLELQYGNTVQSLNTVPNGQTGNSYYPTATEISQKNSILGNNAFLNVKGTVYSDIYYNNATTDEQQSVNIYNYLNYRIMNNNLDYHYANKTMFGYMIRIDTYQFNVDTTIKMKIGLSLNGWTNQYGTDFYAYEIYLLKNIYQSTEYQVNPITGVVTYQWDQYIDMSITRTQPYNIQNEIENINNGFYYTKTQELEQIGYNDYNGIYQDEIEMNLIPNGANFYYITYTPVIRVVYDTSEITMPMQGNIVGNSNNYKIVITGTNIIPDGTYEVVNIPGLMFDVITMPFAFVSQAFNLTIFPGTPYQVNIANLFLSIIAILVFVWLIKKFTKL